MRSRLPAWQWSDYSAKHRDRVNLLLHIVVVPLFQLGMLALIYGVVAGGIAVAVIGAVAMLVSIVVQGRGHRREREAPAPFNSADDFVTRLLVKQWVTFPRFVLSGQWCRNLRLARL
jgi:hypothetical protein